MTLRRTQRTYDLPPTEGLSPAELARAEAWRERWGTLVWTREPGVNRRTGEPMTLLCFNWVRVPLIELGGRRCYDWLGFLAWRRDHEGLKP